MNDRFKPRCIVPAIYLHHEPTLRRRVYVSRINDAVHIRWRLPRAVGSFIAARLDGSGE